MRPWLKYPCVIINVMRGGPSTGHADAPGPG